MSSKAEAGRPAPCVPWCQLQGDPHDFCVRELLREAGPAQPCVLMIAEPDQPWPTVAVVARGQTLVTLDLPTAQSVATVLAYLAPSSRTAAVGQALQRAASLAFPHLGYPEHGPFQGAHNPWKAGPRLGEVFGPDWPAGA